MYHYVQKKYEYTRSNLKFNHSRVKSSQWTSCGSCSSLPHLHCHPCPESYLPQKGRHPDTPLFFMIFLTPWLRTATVTKVSPTIAKVFGIWSKNKIWVAMEMKIAEDLSTRATGPASSTLRAITPNTTLTKQTTPANDNYNFLSDKSL